MVLQHESLRARDTINVARSTVDLLRTFMTRYGDVSDFLSGPDPERMRVLVPLWIRSRRGCLQLSNGSQAHYLAFPCQLSTPAQTQDD